MEKLVLLIDTFCTFPMLEKSKLFRLVLFNFLVGNEDMHLKNYSLIRNGDKVELSPAYDLINSTIILKGGAEEIALSLAGKRRNLTQKVLVDYFGIERCGLPVRVIDKHLNALAQAKETWMELLQNCFLSEELKNKYQNLLDKRWGILGLKGKIVN